MNFTCRGFWKNAIFVGIASLNKPLSKKFLIDIIRFLGAIHIFWLVDKITFSPFPH